MLAWLNSIINYFKSLFWKEEMELTLVGLQNAGKTTFVNVIAVRGEHGCWYPCLSHGLMWSRFSLRR